MSYSCNWKATAFVGIALGVGCTYTPSRLVAPKINSGAAAAALAKYDANGDGAISGEELNKFPALKASLKRADKNKDGRISAEEISERISVWRNSGIALTVVVVHVYRGGAPLPDAEITLVPEEVLGSLKPANGTTDSTGAAPIRISSRPDERGVQLGYYRVQISKKAVDGKETIPGRYNAETELGAEITPDDPALDRITFNLSAS